MTDTDSKEGGRGTSDRLERQEQWAVEERAGGLTPAGIPERKGRKVRGDSHFQT